MPELTMDRRRWLQTSAAVGAGLVLGFKMPVASAKGQSPRDPDDINAWLRIAPDGAVTIMVPTAELGQGVFTSAPVLIAEELQCDWRQVKAEQSPTDPVYNNRMFKVQATASSTSARWSFEPLRRIGAMAREMLKQAAADTWGVPLAECEAHNSVVTHRPSGRSLGYGELAPRAAQLPRPTQVTLKDKSAWSLIGKPVDRLDIPLKVRGAATFGVDVKVPGMLIGTVAACPVFGGKLKHVDTKPALAVRGVKQVVPLADAVIVLADSYWTAKQGLARLKPEWSLPGGALVQGDALMAAYRQAAAETNTIAKRVGDPDAVLARGAGRIDAEYEVPYLAHATMEPMNATVDVRGDRAEVWASTQVCGEIAHMLAPVIGVPQENIVVHSTFVGGGFGRREEFDVFLQAAAASKAAQRPVKLIWSREEDIQHDFYRPAAAARMSAVLGEGGRVEALEARLACSSIYIRNFPARVKDGVDPKSVEGTVDVPYALPHFAVRYAMVNTAVPVGFWRGVGYTQNCFFFESFIDEMAHQAKQDPLAFRLSLLREQPRHAELLRRLGRRAGWGQTQPGRYLGVALSEAWGSICGTVVEVSVRDKQFSIHRVVCAIDSGTIINPATVERQLEGGTVWALAATLDSEITIRDGQVQQSNFHDYRLPHLAQTPRIECELIESGAKIGGVGESAVPPFAPALANALFAASGQRMRSLPLSKHGWSLNAA